MAQKLKILLKHYNLEIKLYSKQKNYMSGV